MSKGWEVALRVADNFTGYGSTAGDTARPGWFLYVDSESLKRNAVTKERDEKLIPTRLSPIESISVEQYNPGGEITFQPRTDDCLNVLFSFFQMATLMHGNVATAGYGAGTGGTWVFTPVGQSLSWSGVAFATSSVYTVNVAKYFGNGLTGTGDGIRFERGITSKLTIDQAPAEDLKMTADMRFYQHTDEVVLGTGFKSMPNSTGSYSSKKMLVDWNGTVVIQGSTAVPVERIKFEFDNNITERRKLGQRGFYQFPFGRALISGEFEAELEDLSVFKQGTSGGTIYAHWQTSDGDWLDVFCPNVFFKAYDPNVTNAGPVMQTIPFRCYPTAFGGSNAAVVSVYPKYGVATLPFQTRLYF